MNFDHMNLISGDFNQLSISYDTEIKSKTTKATTNTKFEFAK